HMLRKSSVSVMCMHLYSEGSRRTWRGVGGDGTKPLCEEGSSATLPIPIRSREPDP
ncbi:hypothetical protein TGVAND_223045B, partial [Toxoplasma gondii VAND]